MVHLNHDDFLLNYRIRTILFTLAFPALAASPYFIKLFNGGIQDCRVIGKNASFKIPAVGRFHAHACASEVCKSRILIISTAIIKIICCKTIMMVRQPVAEDKKFAPIYNFLKPLPYFGRGFSLSL